MIESNGIFSFSSTSQEKVGETAGYGVKEADDGFCQLKVSWSRSVKGLAVMKTASIFRLAANQRVSSSSQRMFDINGYLPMGLVGEVTKPFIWVVQLTHRGLNNRNCLQVTANLEIGSSANSSSNSLMISGYRQQSFRLAPFSSFKLVYQLIPLSSGTVQLPRIKFSVSNCGDLSGQDISGEGVSNSRSEVDVSNSSVNNQTIKMDGSIGGGSESLIVYYPTKEEDFGHGAMAIYVKPAIEYKTLY